VRWLIPVVLAALTACTHAGKPAGATASGPPPPASGESRAIPADLDLEVRRVRVTALFLAEQLNETLEAVRAWRASGPRDNPDLLAVMTLQTPGARGWNVLFVAERREGGVAVIYEGRHPDGEPAGSFRRLDDPRPLVGDEVDAWASRQLAVDRYLRDGSCDGGLETLMVPPRNPGEGFTVYILPLFGKEHIAVGGFRRIRVSADARSIVSDEPLTEGCRSASDAERSIKVRNQAMEVPDEMSLMIAVGLPRTFEVVTARGRWDLTSGRLRFLGDAAR
jgi:hypothetical protein